MSGTESPQAAKMWFTLARSLVQTKLPLTAEEQLLEVLKMLDSNGAAAGAALGRFEQLAVQARVWTEELAEEVEKPPQERADWVRSVLTTTTVGAARVGKLRSFAPTTDELFRFLSERFGGGNESPLTMLKVWKLDITDIQRSAFALKDANDAARGTNFRKADGELAQMLLGQLSEETHNELRTVLLSENQGKSHDELVTLENIGLDTLVERLGYLKRMGVALRAIYWLKDPELMGGCS